MGHYNNTVHFVHHESSEPLLKSGAKQTAAVRRRPPQQGNAIICVNVIAYMVIVIFTIVGAEAGVIDTAADNELLLEDHDL